MALPLYILFSLRRWTKSWQVHWVELKTFCSWKNYLYWGELLKNSYCFKNDNCMIQWSSRFLSSSLYLFILRVLKVCAHTHFCLLKYSFIFNNFQVSDYSFCFSSKCFGLTCVCWLLVLSLCHPFEVFIDTSFQVSYWLWSFPSFHYFFWFFTKPNSINS